MIVNVIELLFVLACLHSSGEFTCNECKQLQDERYTINCNNTCVEDQIETVEEPRNCTEVDQEIGFLETPIMRPSSRGCKQRQNETGKPRNCGMFHGRNKRAVNKLLTCQKCRMFEREGRKIECEKICASSCRQCNERSKETGKNCEDVCGESLMTCHECRQKEKERVPVDCEFTCAKSCHDCEEKQEMTGEDCEFFCGKPRLPCEVCRKQEEEEMEPVNCEWTCEASCKWCHKLQKRLGKKYQCKMYCGQKPSPCLECRKKAIGGVPIDCGKKCDKPCLECRKAEKKGRPVDCSEVCDSSCVGCMVAQEMTGMDKHCGRFCGESGRGMEVKPGRRMEVKSVPGEVLTCEECRQRKKKGEQVSCEKLCEKEKSVAEDEPKPVPCNVCRRQEELGENVDCEWNCDAACRNCETRQNKTRVQLYCEKLCGMPPHPCQTCREREKEGEALDCEWTCASSCIMCEKMEMKKATKTATKPATKPAMETEMETATKMDDEQHCERFCGQPPLPCRACREREKEGELVVCKTLCENTCRECQEAEKISPTPQHCEMFCGKYEPVVETTTRAMTCEECLNNGEWKHPAACAEFCVRPPNMTHLLGYMTCVSCNGITQEECNIPFRDKKDFTVMCEQECEMATFFKPPPEEEEPKVLLVVRGCTGVSESIPAGYILHQIEPCNFMARCNAYDEFIKISNTPEDLDKIDTVREKTSASANHRMSILLTWLLFTYHSVF